jgi:hypothetical protein
MTAADMRGFDPAQEQEHALVNELWLGRRGHLRAYLFELATGVGFAFIGLGFLLDPRNTAIHSLIGRQIPPFDLIWSGMEILGGMLIVAGVVKPHPRLRVMGLLVLGTSLTMRIAAGLLTDPQLGIVSLAMYAGACFLRALMIVRVFLRVRSP